MPHEARTSGAVIGSTSPRRAGPDGIGAVGKRTLVEQLALAEVPGPVQRRVATGAGSGSAGVDDPEAVKTAAALGTSGAGGPLPFRDTIQRVFGRHDVSRIVAHVGGTAADGAARMGAEAFATGDRVAFAGPPTLHTAAHEAAHVVQQRAGVHLQGGVGQHGDAHERHADAVADRVVQGASAEDLLDAGAPASATRGGAAVQRKVRVGQGELAPEKADEVATTDRAQQVLREMLAATAEYRFDDHEELKSFLTEVARTDWGAPPVEENQSIDEQVSGFASGRVELGRDVWASDHRVQGDLRVTRTNTLNKRFKTFKDKARSNDQKTSEVEIADPHRVVGSTEQGAKKETIQHVYSAMMTSLAPGSGDDRAQANQTMREGSGSVMNCEQFVAYTLWGGGVIKDWELALIFAACAQDNSMEMLYRAMGFNAAQLVQRTETSLGLDAVSVLFESNQDQKQSNQVSHMLLYTDHAVIELNAGRQSLEQWKARSTPEDSYVKQLQKHVFACPVSAIPAELQDTLNAIVQKHPGGRLLAPKLVDDDPTPQQTTFGFLRYEKREV